MLVVQSPRCDSGNQFTYVNRPTMVRLLSDMIVAKMELQKKVGLVYCSNLVVLETHPSGSFR